MQTAGLGNRIRWLCALLCIANYAAGIRTLFLFSCIFTMTGWALYKLLKKETTGAKICWTLFWLSGTEKLRWPEEQLFSVVQKMIHRITALFLCFQKHHWFAVQHLAAAEVTWGENINFLDLLRLQLGD